MAVFVHVELQLEQLEVVAVFEQLELQLVQLEVLAVSEQDELQELHADDEADVLQFIEQSEQADDVALLLQLLLQLITCLSISSPQLFNTPENVLPNATKPKKGTALVTIVLKNSLRE